MKNYHLHYSFFIDTICRLKKYFLGIKSKIHNKYNNIIDRCT